MILHAFEPGSCAVALFLLHSHIPHLQRRRPCNRIKILLRKNKRDIRELTIDEIADPTLDLMNYHSHQIHNVLHHLPLSSSPYILSLYFLIMVLVVLI